MRDHDEVRALLDGPVNSLPTIFTESGEIDWDGTRAVIDKSLEGDCNVIMLTWGDSLISLLTDDEIAELHRVVAEHVNGRALTIACDNQWGLNKAVEFGRYVRELGFDLYMVRPADWARGTPETLADFYKACGREAPVMFVGDVPIRTLELVSDDPNMWAFKEDLTRNRSVPPVVDCAWREIPSEFWGTSVSSEVVVRCRFSGYGNPHETTS